MILKVILVIFLCFIAGNYLSSMLAIRFVWDGLVHLGGLVRLGSIAVCFLFVRFKLQRVGVTLQLLCAGFSLWWLLSL